MARHRDVRNMDFSEDYDGYDDVYGHSVDDDYYISPSHRQFMYNRENSGYSKGEYPMEQDIQEEDTSDDESKISELDKIKLNSCLDHVKSIVGTIQISRQELVKICVDNKFECDKIIDVILNIQSAKQQDRKDKDFTKRKCDQRKNSNIDFQQVTLLPLLKENSDSREKFLSKMNNDRIQEGNNHTISFLSKIKNTSKTDHSSSFLSKIKKPENSSESPVVSLLSKIKSGQEMPNTSAEGNFHSISFLSKIKKVTNSNMESDGSSICSTSSEPSPNLSLFSTKKQDEFSKHFLNFLEENSLKKCKSEIVTTNEVTRNLTELKLDEVESTPEFNLNLNIDLSKAVISNDDKKEKIKSKIDRNEKFVLPSLNCEKKFQVDKISLDCSLDMSRLALKKIFYQKKRSSQFGKILSIKFKIPKNGKKIETRSFNSNFKVKFDFSTESPDDKIRKHLRRNL